MSLRRVERMIIELAVQQFLSEQYQDGDVVSHEWIQRYLEIPTPQSDPNEQDPLKKERGLLADAQRVQFVLLSRVEDFKRALLEEHRVALESIRGVGYRVVPPDDQAAFAVTEAARIIRKGIERGVAVLDHARFEQMSDQAHRRHLDAQAKMHGLQLIMTREKRDVFKLFGPAEQPDQDTEEDES